MIFCCIYMGMCMTERNIQSNYLAILKLRANNIPIINPGPLLYGQFMYIILEQNEDKKWEYNSTHFMRLENKK